jgi:predicted nucleotidyltransferase
MTGKQNIIQVIRESYPYLSSEFGVKRVGLFGSYARDIEGENSDIDIIVEFERSIGFKFNELSEFLEKLFGRKVDIMTQEGLKNIRIKEIAEDIKGSIIYV